MQFMQRMQSTLPISSGTLSPIGQSFEQCMQEAQFLKSEPRAKAMAQSSRWVSIWSRLNLFVRPRRAPNGQMKRQNGRFIIPIRSTRAASMTTLSPNTTVRKFIPSAPSEPRACHRSQGRPPSSVPAGQILQNQGS